MKIKYLRLDNFIGILAGLGKDTIEIDFTKNKSKFVLLKGSNGSGKTTILSSLNPFATSNDNRNNVIIEGREGYKEIHYDIFGDEYIIKHYINKSTKSFISKNGEELNPNGGVKTFNELILNIFGIDKSYFKIARLGSNMTNFIDMPTSERKKYISNFIGDVDYYLELHKHANEILRDLNSNNKYLENELSKLDSEANLQIRLSHINTEREILKKELDETFNKISVAEFSIFELSEVEDTNKYYRSFKQLESEYVIIKEKYDENVAKRPNLYEMTIEEIKERKNNNEIAKGILSGKIAEAEGKLNSLQQNKNVLDNNLNSINIVKLEKDVKTIEDTISEYEGLIQSINEMVIPEKYEYLMSKGINNKNYLEQQIESYKKILIQINELLISECFQYYSNDKLAFLVKEKEEVFNALSKEEKELETRIKVLESEMKSEEVINKRPESCKIDNCPFINAFLQFKGASVKYEENITKLKGVKEQKKLVQVEFEFLKEVQSRITS